MYNTRWEKSRDPLSPQWEDCKVCGGDHWTKDHGFVRCPLCGDPERDEDIVGGVCLTCADGIAFAQNARRGAISVPSHTGLYVVCGIDNCEFGVEYGEGRAMALHQSEDHPDV